MRIYMVFNGNDSYYFHEMAIRLRDKYGVEKFAGIVQGNRPYEFLKNQKDIDYQRLDSFQEIFNKYNTEEINYRYLNKIEEEYGNPFLWFAVYPERNVLFDRDLTAYINSFQKYSHEDILKLLQVFFKQIIKAIEDFKPDYIIMDNVSTMPHYILYLIANKKKIPTLMLGYTRISNRFFITKGPFEVFEKISKIFKKILNGEYKSPFEAEAIYLLKKYRKSEIKPEYIIEKEKKYREFFSIETQMRRVLRIIHYTREYYFGYYKDDYTFKNKNPIRASYEEIKKILRKKIYHFYGFFDKPNYNENFIFFPLHFDPELATTVVAPFYINQIMVIEALAKSIPVTFKLYVKEHPSMYPKGLRPIIFYKRLLKIPNVKLIDPRVSSYELIKRCKGVVTITGTAGWEAAVLKKPVVTFGKPIYSILSTVKKVNDLEKLPYLVKWMLNDYKYNEEELIAYISALLEHSFTLNRSEILRASNQYLKKEPSILRNNAEFKKLVDKFAEEMGLKKE